jgi:pSer/pThr/pTyr-binding forkhead associated (FHA) protein
MDVSLVMFTHSGERRDFPIRRKTIIGRTSECDIQIELDVVSRRHCELTRKTDMVAVRDLGSSNGTYVNNKRIQQANMEAGDTLTVGPVIFTLVFDGEPANIKPIRTILEDGKPTAKPQAAGATSDDSTAGPPNPGDSGSIDLHGSSEMELVAEDDDAEASNSPLAALEELAKQKKP